MNIEVKRSIEIDVVLDILEDFKLEAENKEENKITVERKEMIELLEDTIQIIKALIKKNNQLRDINKNLNEKLEKRNATISDLTNQLGKSNTLMFEMQIPEGKCDCGNKCCCEKDEEESGDKKEEPTLQDVLKELEVINELVVISKLIGIL